VVERRGWKGPSLGTDDELLLAIQRRLSNTDRTTVAKAEKEERRQFLPLALVMIVLYLLKVLPKRQKARVRKRMLNTLHGGARVVTGGGLIGTVARIENPEEVLIDLADGVRVRALRSTISSVLSTPGLTTKS
jgi:preprotein translocase YajC subunit